MARRDVNFQALAPRENPAEWVRPFKERAKARLYKFQPVTVEDRLKAFRLIRFQPHGLFLPDDPALQMDLKKKVHLLGEVESEDERLEAYVLLQRESEQMQLAGIPGKWTGQQAVARSPARFRIVAWGRRAGKALALDTPLPTPDGWTTMADVREGDYLLDEQGKPCRVTYTTEVMDDHRCYEIEFSDSQRVIADAEHVWRVEGRQQRRTDRNRKPKGPVLRTTQQLVDGTHAGDYWAVPCAKPLDLPEKIFPLDPYVLGVWLGDGLTTDVLGTVFFSDDAEVVAEVRRRGYTANRRSAKYAYGITGIRPAMRGLDLFDNKHVPDIYLRGSYEQRLDLLKGLMDTDGYVDVKGRCEFTSTRQCLAEGVVELLGTLGQKAHMTVGRATLNGRFISLKYRVAFKPTIPVFILPRKLARQTVGDGWFRTKRYIRSIRPVESVPVRCIVVDSPNHLFLCGGFIPTHNTYYAASEAVAIAIARPRSWIWLAAPISKLVGRSFDYAVQYVQDLGLESQCQIRNQVQEKQIILPNGSRIEGISLENYLSAAGAAIDFAVIDEAAQIVPDAWTRAILPPLMDRNGGALLISSYEGEGDFFSDKVLEVQAEAEKARTQGREYTPQWELFQAASYDVNFYAFPQGINTKTLVEARREMPVVDFLEQFGAQVAGSRERVYREFSERIHVGNYPYNTDHPVRLAADPSSGANPYAIAVIQDYGDYMVIIDELYERGVKIEEYDPIMRRRPWAENVIDCVLDSAWPHDIARWNELGWRAYPVQKPMVEESILVVKEMLRNSRLWDAFYRARLNWFLQADGHEPDADAYLAKEVMHEISQKVEESLASENLTADDIHTLKDCSRIFVNRSCVNTILEFKSYSWRKRRNLATNFAEKPRAYQDHLMDAIRYFVWTNHRWAANDHPKLRSFMTYKGPREAAPGLTEMPKLTSQQQQGRLWVDYHRSMYLKQSGARSYMKTVS